MTYFTVENFRLLLDVERHGSYPGVDTSLLPLVNTLQTNESADRVLKLQSNPPNMNINIAGSSILGPREVYHGTDCQIILVQSTLDRHYLLGYDTTVSASTSTAFRWSLLPVLQPLRISVRPYIT
jgi:hypothetical protein